MPPRPSSATPPTSPPGDDGDGDSSLSIPVVSETIVRAEIDIQISTAKQYPRSIKRSLDEAKSMALLSEEAAASCCYAVPRSGKTIKGPSVRLAEIVASAWGNLRVEKRAGEVGDDFVSAEGIVWDLEKNTAMRVVKKRRIRDKHGRRYSDDMIQNTLNAAASISMRDAVFVVVPKSFVHDVYDAAEDLAVGKIETLAVRRQKALEFFGRYGITEERVAGRMKRAAMADLTLDDVAALRSLVEQIRRGETSIDAAFPEHEEAEDEGPTDAASIARDVIGGVSGAKQPADPPAAKAEEARRAKIREQAAAMGGRPQGSDATGGEPSGPAPSPKPDSPAAALFQDECKIGLPGCSRDAADFSRVNGRTVCANHAAAVAASGSDAKPSKKKGSEK